MSELIDSKPSTAYYVIAGIFLIWNATGLMFYYMQVTMTPEVMMANFTPEQVQFMNNIPAWATAAYATAVTVGVLAAVSLLLRKAWAVPLFIVSFIAVLIQDLDSFVLNNAIEVWGTSGLYLPILVIIICIAEILYSRSAKAKNWLS